MSTQFTLLPFHRPENTTHEQFLQRLAAQITFEITVKDCLNQEIIVVRGVKQDIRNQVRSILEVLPRTTTNIIFRGPAFLVINDFNIWTDLSPGAVWNFLNHLNEVADLAARYFLTGRILQRNEFGNFFRFQDSINSLFGTPRDTLRDPEDYFRKLYGQFPLYDLTTGGTARPAIPPPRRPMPPRGRRRHRRTARAAPMGSPGNIDLDDYPDQDFIIHDENESPVRLAQSPSPALDPSPEVAPASPDPLVSEPRYPVSPPPTYDADGLIRFPDPLGLPRDDGVLLEAFRRRGPPTEGVNWETHNLGNHAYYPAGRVFCQGARGFESHLNGTYILPAKYVVPAPGSEARDREHLYWRYPATHQAQFPILLAVDDLTERTTGLTSPVRLMCWINLQYRTTPDKHLILQDITLAEIHLAHH